MKGFTISLIIKLMLIAIVFVQIDDIYSDSSKKSSKKKSKRSALNKEKEQEAFLRMGANYYNSFCAFCHAFNGKGILRRKPDVYMAPSLVKSARVTGDADNVIRILLHGLTGPVNGKSYLPIEMVAPKSFDDKQLSAIISYIRNTWSNEAPFVNEEDIKRVRELEKDREKPWTAKELDALIDN